MAKDPEAATKVAVPDKETILKLVQDGEEALADRNEWEQKLRGWFTRRFGLRASKSFPWPGASNLNMPFTDKLIRRLKPTFQAAVFRVNPIAHVEPLGEMTKSSAIGVENGYDWLVRYRMRRARETMTFVNDYMLTYGFGLVKPVWTYNVSKQVRRLQVDFLEGPLDVPRVEIPQSTILPELVRRLGLEPGKHDEQINDAVSQFYDGADPIEITIEEIEYSAPRWHPIDPIDAIVPWDSTTDVDALPWIIHRIYMTDHELNERVANGKFDAIPQGLMRADTSRSGGTAMDGDLLEQRRQLREGVHGSSETRSRPHELWECYFRFDADGDGIAEKYVATVHKKTNHILRVVPFPYEHGEWPFIRFSFESTEDRWYSSRGIPEMIWDLQDYINANHNAWVDNMAIVNSASFIYKQGTVVNPKSWVWSPGSMHPVRQTVDNIRPVTHQPMDFSFNAQEETLRQTAEEYVGGPDFGISNINQRVERRTATEIQQIQQSAGAVAEETLERYQESMRRLHRQTLFLWAQFGDDTVLVRVTGKDEQLPFSRFDILQDFDLVPSGRLDNLTPQVRASRAFQMLSLAESPVAGPYVRTFEIVRDIVENMDYRNAERYLVDEGATQSDAFMSQITEIQFMHSIGQVHEVDERDPHEIHAQVTQLAIEAHQDDQDFVIVLSGHLAMHLFFLGQQEPLQNFIQQTGFQVQQIGTKLVMQQPEPQQEGAV
jgi:hypothetical protein